ncbi:MAG: hypothetical protein HPY52_11095 [Firmicutes bacterium]|nr:hypothetical protein [Bacillota bacterium]
MDDLETQGGSPAQDAGYESAEAENQVDETNDMAAPEGTPAEAGDAGETTEQPQPRKYAGKYASPEELERAYIESQRLISRQGEELSKYRAQAPIPGLGNTGYPAQGYPQMIPQVPQQMPQMPMQPAQAAPQIDPKELNEKYLQSFYDNPLQTQLMLMEAAIAQRLTPLEKQLQSMRDEAVLSQFRSDPDFGHIEGAVKQIMQYVPELRQYGDAGWKIAYLAAKAQYAEDAVILARNAGADAATSAMAAKAASAVAGSGGRSGMQGPLSPQEQIIQGVREAWKARGGGF